MSLNLYNIYENLIFESVGRPQIIDSINQPYRVKIYYQGENESAPNWRFIDPYVLGTSLAGNEIVRAFQAHGFTTTERSTWKTFRTDRILRWEPTKYHIGKLPIEMYGQMMKDIENAQEDKFKSDIPQYKQGGVDAKMTNIIAWRKFDEFDRDTIAKQKYDKSNGIKTKPINPIKPTNIPPVEPVKPIEPVKPVDVTKEKPEILKKPKEKQIPTPKPLVNKQPIPEPVEPQVTQEPLPTEPQPEINPNPIKGIAKNKKI